MSRTALGHLVKEQPPACVGEFHDPTGHWLLMHDPEDNEFCMV
ncbi:hypothetical protein ACSFCK_11780 [Brevibacterium luteolum]